MRWLNRTWVEVHDIGRNRSPRNGRAVDSIVLHYTTAGHYLNTVRWFEHPECKRSSAHFVVGRRGQIVQLVPLDMAAWHAGDGDLDGGSPNLCSVGVEVANHGLLTRRGDSWYTDWGLAYDARYSDPEEASLTYSDGRVVSGYWEPYTHHQVGAVAVLCQALIDEYAIPLNRIVGHQDVAPAIKSDPGPLWPWEDLLGKLTAEPGNANVYRRTSP